MRIILLIVISFATIGLQAQELFTWSEPASNMAAKSIGVRANNILMNENGSGKYNYHLLPEIMWGISKKVMLHAEVFLSNRNKGLAAEGGSLYFKYRFFSQDEVHSHFRLAAYARAAINNSAVHQEAIDFNGHNSGYEAGMVATKLLNKIALSAGGSFVHAVDNANNNKFNYVNADRNAVAYNLALGKLMLPKEYVSYNQVNMNLMLEVLGQANLGTGKTFLDLAPTIQFIIKSRMRVDGSYRFPVVQDLQRSASRGFLLRLEYNIFNAYK